VDLTLLWYVIAGLVGGVIFVLMPPMVTDTKTIIQRVGLGAILGGISYLIYESQSPATVGTPQSYIAVIGVGYLAIDGLTKLFGAKPGSSGTGQQSSNIPL